MASSEYRVIESADGTFTVELWETGRQAKLLFRRDGFGTREEAQAWSTPANIIEPHPITTTQPGRPAWFIDVGTED
jgi:hypothetical protein